VTLSRLAYVLKVFPKISETFIGLRIGGIAAAVGSSCAFVHRAAAQ